MKFPIGIQQFDKLRTGGWVYVDKTALIHKMVNEGTCCFLSRPRRFGKSLLVSTLEAYFQGRKDLFEGLAIAELETEWKVYPVLHFDLNAKAFTSLQDLYDVLNDQLIIYEQLYESVAVDKSPEGRLRQILRMAYKKTGERAVILVDEYDKPLLQNIVNVGLQDEMRNALKAFYGVLKSMDGHIKFALLTGVSKFGKVSVFSDLNNLRDLSMLEQYSGICGISEKELHLYFRNEISEMAEKHEVSYEEMADMLRQNYDGYHFAPNTEGMYNPFSLLNVFANKRFANYWFETGTPTYLVELLKNSNYDLSKLQNSHSTDNVLNAIDVYGNDPIPVIYQSGYLTIKSYDPEFMIYTLDFPNKEVEEGFVRFLAPLYSPMPNEAESVFTIQNFLREVRCGDIDGFLTRLRSFFSDTTYEVIRLQELHYSNVLYIVFKLLGFYTQVEYKTSNGRVDLVLQTPDYIYVMEFKLNGSAQEALQQIVNKGYALPFEKDSRKLYKIGINFSAKTRNIDEWVVA